MQADAAGGDFYPAIVVIGAHLISHPEQGWSLLCNGIVVFEDTGELLPGGASVAPHRPTDIVMTPLCPAKYQDAPVRSISASPAA
jgi:hypothetical protein